MPEPEKPVLLEKRCNRCHVDQPLSGFAKARLRPDGFQGTCKACQAVYRAAHAAEIAAYNKQYAKDPSKAGARRVAGAKWYASNLPARYAAHIQRAYGLSLEEYDAMYAACGGRCEICRDPVLHGQSLVRTTGKAVVDHCHSTLRVRGLLCNHCNRCLSVVDKHHDAVMRYLNKAT